MKSLSHPGAVLWYLFLSGGRSESFLCYLKMKRNEEKGSTLVTVKYNLSNWLVSFLDWASWSFTCFPVFFRSSFFMFRHLFISCNKSAIEGISCLDVAKWKSMEQHEKMLFMGSLKAHPALVNH